MIERLRRFFHLGVEGEEPEPTTLPPEPEDTLDDLLEQIEPTPPAKAEGVDPRVAEAERKAQEAERRAQEAEARLRATPAPTPTADPEYEAEERQLREAKEQGADENALKWLKWQIGVNRKQRETERKTDFTLASARDLADKSAFDALEASKPKVYKAYAKRVEEQIENFRRSGQPVPPRRMVLTFLIGQDMLDGKVKAKAKPAAAETPPIPRGKLPSALSDVRKGQSSATSEREKRRARLENQII